MLRYDGFLFNYHSNHHYVIILLFLTEIFIF